jgi:hypothetical protein
LLIAVNSNTSIAELSTRKITIPFDCQNITDQPAAMVDSPRPNGRIRLAVASDGSPIRVTIRDAQSPLDVYVRRQE